MPALGNSEAPLSQLMVWWALLFGLSIVARYDPALWTRALNPDSSPLAVPLESLLEEALEVVPALVLEPMFGNSSPVRGVSVTGANERELDRARRYLDRLHDDPVIHGPLPEPSRRKRD
jgi:hypothetical protein